ncbi:hypothetical protein Atc_2458 [Acidithiobacillus caldus SM-1]|uniref:Uncharacterized protein n=1 Tax=Acidithiobacillus caldus (strain SM-1) TaxID=990288 RepID=F9ZRU1_ACICS|nr:hypothetical protein Atc_2458 [Acidithiobacillus caldus SM-1]
MAAQEGIALPLLAQGRGQAGLSRLPLPTDALQPFAENAVVGLHHSGKAQIGEGILVRAADPGAIGQPRELLQTGKEHGGVALEDPATASGKQGVATEKQVLPVKGEMIECVSRHLQHPDLTPIDVGGPLAKGVGACGNGAIAGAVHGTAVGGGQLRYAANVVGVVMGTQNGAGTQTTAGQLGGYGCGSAGIDDPDCGFLRQGEQIDIIVAKCRDEGQGHVWAVPLLQGKMPSMISTQDGAHA